MTAGLPLFSDAWCAEALEVAQATAEIHAGLADPGSFNVTITFECTEPPGPASRVEFVAGEPVGWTSGGAGDPQGARLSAPVEVWRQAAEGDPAASRLLISRKIKLRDTRQKAIASNYRALDALTLCWGELATDWDV